MKFKGQKGLIVNGVEFIDDIFETNDKVLIERFLTHPGLGRFFSEVQEEEIVEEETEEEKKKKHQRTIDAEKMKEREARGLELSKKTAKELYTIASGLGFGGSQLPKDALIIEIIKLEEDLKNISEGVDNDS